MDYDQQLEVGNGAPDTVPPAHTFANEFSAYAAHQNPNNSGNPMAPPSNARPDDYPTNPLDSVYPPDNFGDEGSPDARVWQLHSDVMMPQQKEWIDSAIATVDIMLLFATLFSAVSTTFVTVAFQDFTPDYNEYSARLLFAIMAAQAGNSTSLRVPTPDEFAATGPGSQTLWHENAALEHEIAVLQRLKATEQRLRTERDTVRVDVLKLQEENAALRAKNAEQVDVEKQLNLAVSRGANTALRDQVVSLRRQQTTSDAAANQMRREKATLEEQVANMRRRTEEDAATTARLRLENIALGNDIATLRRQKQEDAATISSLRRDSERLAEFVERERLWRQARSDLEQLHREWQERIRVEEEAARKREEQRRRETTAFNRLSGQWDALRQSSTQTPDATLTPRQQYETVWSQRLCPSSKLTFDAFPWPVAPGTQIISTAAVETFLLDGVEASRRKQAIRSQLLRWHPDKFTARGILDHVVSSDWERVLQRQKEVVLCLTTLLARV
ncbi:hypothetical protein EXIGLDRAFT_842714 [Exidia glandulosa HHB12029]|uniref:DUF6535 domain-containing protein n=1 Tax=Exidia glandulosa HHB12029 TaxID=1314781 RepID=A0A165D4B3_EXIGL|nr:hypothetical protein EXIGLDRAFT_842714 [Exidia glandulosa HHB12029]